MSKQHTARPSEILANMVSCGVCQATHEHRPLGAEGQAHEVIWWLQILGLALMKFISRVPTTDGAWLHVAPLSNDRIDYFFKRGFKQAHAKASEDG